MVSREHTVGCKPAVCAVCGDLHETNMYGKLKSDAILNKCSNCGGNRTANYRGCLVHSIFKHPTIEKIDTVPIETYRTQVFDQRR